MMMLVHLLFGLSLTQQYVSLRLEPVVAQYLLDFALILQLLDQQQNLVIVVMVHLLLCLQLPLLTCFTAFVLS